MKTYQFRVYPNKKQQLELWKWFWQARFVYNKGLETWNEIYKNGEKVNYYVLANKLKEWKQEDVRLKECYSQCLQQSLKNLDTAFQNFFKKRWGYPKFKNKDKNNSLIFPQYTSITDSHIKLPKLWLVKCKFHRGIEGNIKRMSVKKTPVWKYYVSITTDYEWKRTNWTWAVAIDVGIKEFWVCSDWIVIPNPRHLKKHLKKLKKQQRRLSRKKKWSKNRNKQRLKVARIHEKVANSRKDFLHKTSTTIANQYDTVVLEDLTVSNIKGSKSLNQAISDMWWRTFRTMCEYKMNVEIVNPYNTSKTCSNCWNIKEDLTLKDRRYTCNACWLEIDRDYNASLNILARAIY